MAINGRGRPSTRPTVYSEEVATEIERLMADERVNIVQIARMPHMPSASTIYRWRAQNPEFDARCARAREGLAENFFTDIDDLQQEMASAQSDLELNILAKRISTLQWMAAKVGPKGFGDKREMLVSGNANSPIKVETTNVLDVSTLSVAQLEALESALRQTVYALDAPKDDEGVIEGEIVGDPEEND
jgi:hypothetical protein